MVVADEFKVTAAGSFFDILLGFFYLADVEGPRVLVIVVKGGETLLP